MKTYCRRRDIPVVEKENIQLAENKNKCDNNNSWDGSSRKKGRITDFFHKNINIDTEDETRRVKGKEADCSSRKRVAKQTQTFLNFGQTRKESCDECGFMFDEFEGTPKGPLHARFHSRHTDLLRDAIRKYQGKARWYWFVDGGKRVILELNAAKMPNVFLFIDLINELMGGGAAISSESIEKYSIFLYIERRRTPSKSKKSKSTITSNGDVIEGVMLTEAIDGGIVMFPNSEVRIKVDKPYIGISRIWVDPRARRKGIAVRMLNCIRKCQHVNGDQCEWSKCRVEANCIAFSQPTADGRALAQYFHSSCAQSESETKSCYYIYL